jgi:hypothetical protein
VSKLENWCSNDKISVLYLKLYNVDNLVNH